MESRITIKANFCEILQILGVIHLISGSKRYKSYASVHIFDRFCCCIFRLNSALYSGKVCSAFPEKGALNFRKGCTFASEYSLRYFFLNLLSWNSLYLNYTGSSKLSNFILHQFEGLHKLWDTPITSGNIMVS